MTKTEKELKKEFSAYVKTAIKNTQKQYLIKKGKILDNTADCRNVSSPDA